jgi:hypothetical protein
LASFTLCNISSGKIVILYNQSADGNYAMNPDRLSAVWAPSALGVLSILRIFTGLALLQHGTGKILGFPLARCSQTSRSIR